MDEQKKKHLRNDFILLGVVALLAVCYFLYKALLPAEQGAVVVVEVYGEEYARLPLNTDTVFDIDYQGNHNRLEIRGGYASVTEANCPDGLCTYQSDIMKNGEMIICLPNWVLVIVEGGEDSGLDSIAQ